MRVLEEELHKLRFELEERTHLLNDCVLVLELMKDGYRFDHTDMVKLSRMIERIQTVCGFPKDMADVAKMVGVKEYPETELEKTKAELAAAREVISKMNEADKEETKNGND